jgi:hypothetical protein
MPSATLPNTEDKAAIKKALPSKVNVSNNSTTE